MSVEAPNCAVTCVNGCILGDQCPHLVYLAAARQYIETTSWEQMMETAEDYTQGKLPLPSDLERFLGSVNSAPE